MPCQGGNATDPIWSVLASSQGISCWTHLKPQQSNSNPNRLANRLWCIDFLTRLTPLIIPHRLPALNLICKSKTDARFMQDAPKAVWSIPYVSVTFFVKFKTDFLHIVLLKCPYVQVVFLKFTSFDNQALVGYIPISAIAVYLNVKS